MSTEKLEKVLSKLEYGKRITGPDHSGCLEGIASGLSGKSGEIAVSVVLRHELPGGVDVLFDGNGTNSCPSSGRSLVCVRCGKSWDKHRVRPRLHPEFSLLIAAFPVSWDEVTGSMWL